jgi:hypothetical protein
MREGHAGERADGQAHSLSLASACNPYYERIPWHRITRSAFSPLVFHLAPTHLGWDTQRQIYSSVQGPPGVKTTTPSIEKMYQDLKKTFWWCCMKMEIAEYVTRCDDC